MIQKEPRRVVITTPKGTVIVARPLFERLEAKLKPEDQGLLRTFEWWVQASELVNGIQIAMPTPQRRARRFTPSWAHGKNQRQRWLR